MSSSQGLAEGLFHFPSYPFFQNNIIPSLASHISTLMSNKKKQEDRLIEKAWKSVINNGAFLFIQMDRQENILDHMMHHFEETDIEVADLHCDLALQYLKCYDLPKAIELMEKALAAYWIKLELDATEVIRTELELAKMYWLHDQEKDAAHLLEDLLEFVSYKAGPDYPSRDLLLRLLALVYREGTEPFKAIDLFHQLLEKETDQDLLVHRQIDLAKAYREAGLTATAIELLMQSLEENQPQLGIQHPDIIALQWQLALGYADLGCYAEAFRRSEAVYNYELHKQGFACVDIACILDLQSKWLYKIG